MGGGGSVRGGRGESSSATKVEPEKINFADVCAISAATDTSSSLSSQPALCNHGHDHHAHHTHSPSPPLAPTVINGTAVPHWSANYDGLLLSSSTVRKRQRASVSELRQRSVSLFSFPSSTVRECCQRASASGHRTRTYFGWVRAHDPCAVVRRTLPVDQSTHYGSKLTPN
jgi:hypothetical protein